MTEVSAWVRPPSVTVGRLTRLPPGAPRPQGTPERQRLVHCEDQGRAVGTGLTGRVDDGDVESARGHKTAGAAHPTMPGHFLWLPPPCPITRRAAPHRHRRAGGRGPAAGSGDQRAPGMSPTVKSRSTMPSDDDCVVNCDMATAIGVPLGGRGTPDHRRRLRPPPARRPGRAAGRLTVYALSGTTSTSRARPDSPCSTPSPHRRRRCTPTAAGTRTCPGPRPTARSASSPGTSARSCVT